MSEYLKHQNLGVMAFYAGRYRYSADEYWKAFLSVPSQTHEARYYLLHGCTSTLRGAHFEASESDFEKMRGILENKHEPRLFRVEAGYTLGILHYDREERHKCEEMYQRAITIGERKLSKAKDSKREETCLLTKGDGKKSTMKEIMMGVLEDCKKNLKQMNSATRVPAGAFFSPEGNPIRMTHQMLIGRGGTTLTNAEITNLTVVGGLRCDYCKKEATKLELCSRCRMGFYCSKECQRNQWTIREHKKYCRIEGQFEPGDLVQCARLKNNPELNGFIVRVIGPDTTSIEERYKVQAEGAVKGDRIISIKPENLNQLRPFDCRN
ncbi:hypothetical protein HJC23_006367 [Cyclotella cryptica]|uniref:MYND-type domain-containing protein n=1 Tax=Cyclotella cryptica TaxID=29204 RepID=A0ABD3Q698_9STRA